MKFITLSRITQLWKRKSETQNNGPDNFHQKVVRFEDCERINRERFNSTSTTRISSINQIYAALSGGFTYIFSSRCQWLIILFILVNILATSVGASIGWISPSISFLQSQETTLDRQLNSEEISWLGGLLPLGAMLGTVLFAWLAEIYGRFWMLWLSGFPQIVSFTVSIKQLITCYFQFRFLGCV